MPLQLGAFRGQSPHLEHLGQEVQHREGGVRLQVVPHRPRPRYQPQQPQLACAKHSLPCSTRSLSMRSVGAYTGASCSCRRNRQVTTSCSGPARQAPVPHGRAPQATMPRVLGSHTRSDRTSA